MTVREAFMERPTVCLTLAPTTVSKLFLLPLFFKFSYPVKNNDGVVDGKAKHGKQRRHKQGIHFHSIIMAEGGKDSAGKVTSCIRATTAIKP